MQGRRTCLLYNASGERLALLSPAALDVYADEAAPGAASVAAPHRLVAQDKHELRGARCGAWSPEQAGLPPLALGFDGGRVLLADFGESADSGAGGCSHTELFAPPSTSYDRVNDLAWHPAAAFAGRLAAAMERRGKGDLGILVWDVARAEVEQQSLRQPERPRAPSVPDSPVAPQAPPAPLAPGRAAGEMARPVLSMSPADSVAALAWVPGQPECMAAGTNFRYLNLYDTRVGMDATMSVAAHQRAVYGVRFDPTAEHIVATFDDRDSVAKIWDIRRLKKPVVTIKPQLALRTDQIISDIRWSSRIPHTLATVMQGNSVVALWGLSGAVKSDSDSTVITQTPKRRCRVRTIQEVSAMAWHPHSSPPRFLAADEKGGLEDVLVSQPKALSWGRSLAAASGAQLNPALYTPDAGGRKTPDVDAAMLRRAKAAYSVEIAANQQLLAAEVAAGGKDVHGVAAAWNWMLDMQSMSSSLYADAGLKPTHPFQGLRRTMQALGSTRSQSVRLGGERSPLHVSAFTGKSRQIAMTLCDWPGCGGRQGGVTAELELHLAELEAGGKYTRAALLALFQADLARAVASISRAVAARQGADAEVLRLVAVALAGYRENNPLWSDTASALGVLSGPDCKLTDPYLKLAFRFLSYCTQSYAYRQRPAQLAAFMQDVVLEAGLSLSDQAAVACRLLPDDELELWLEAREHAAKDRGDLRGLPLVGMAGPQCVPLFQRFVDMTGDIQSAACMLAHVVPKFWSGPGVVSWVEEYRDLLDRWRMFRERGLIDAAFLPHVKEKPRMYVRCTYCSQPMTVKGAKKKKGRSNQRGRAESQASGCPSCKRPLSRCCVCQFPLDAPMPRESSPKSAMAPVHTHTDPCRYCVCLCL